MFCTPILHSLFTGCIDALSHIMNYELQESECGPCGGATSVIVAMSVVGELRFNLEAIICTAGYWAVRFNSYLKGHFG